MGRCACVRRQFVISRKNPEVVDPADLSGEEARRVAHRLLELANEADDA
jgi:hypothetical protein